MDFTNERLQKIYEKIASLEEQLKKNGAEADKEGAFPFDNIRKLREIGYMGLTVPKAFGGEEISLYELVLFQEKLAQADGSTALSLGWHLGIMMDLAERRPWEEALYAKICKEVVTDGALLNRAATEPKTGSPTRGGKPETTAARDTDGWRITGRKTFTTMAPVLDYFLVAATMEEIGEVGEFLIPRKADGVSIEETWDSIAMRGTASHDLVLDDVAIPEMYLVEENRTKRKTKASGWLLHIPACYLGIAQAARNEAARFAVTYSPSSITGTISELPNVRKLMGDIELDLKKARYFLHAVAKQWDDEPERKGEMAPELSAAKHVVTNTAVRVVDQAMRLVGARSLSAAHPPQRYYRDVRAGLHNPPMDDAVINMLAEQAFQSVKL